MRLTRYTFLVFCATFCLVVAGGLVTSTGSGLSVPEWPRSYGTLNPPMIGGIRFEHSHRLIAGFVGILTLVMTVWMCVAEKRAWMRMLAVSASVLVIAQAVLGGLTVIYLLPLWISALHATVAQTFFALLASLVLFRSREWTGAVPVPARYARSAKRLTVVTTGFIYCQLILGSLVRHGATAFVNAHIVVAVLIAMHTVFIFHKIFKDPAMSPHLTGHAQLLAGLVFIQLLLGFGAYAVAIWMPQKDVAAWSEVVIRTAHQANGALVIAACVLLMLRVFRRYENVR